MKWVLLVSLLVAVSGHRTPHDFCKALPHTPELERELSFDFGEVVTSLRDAPDDKMTRLSDSVGKPTTTVRGQWEIPTEINQDRYSTPPYRVIICNILAAGSASAFVFDENSPNARRFTDLNGFLDKYVEHYAQQTKQINLKDSRFTLLWLVDEDGNFAFAPEFQYVKFAAGNPAHAGKTPDGNGLVKIQIFHGDIIPGATPFDDAIPPERPLAVGDNRRKDLHFRGAFRGRARLGGEINRFPAGTWDFNNLSGFSIGRLSIDQAREFWPKFMEATTPVDWKKEFNGGTEAIPSNFLFVGCFLHNAGMFPSSIIVRMASKKDGRDTLTLTPDGDLHALHCAPKKDPVVEKLTVDVAKLTLKAGNFMAIRLYYYSDPVPRLEVAARPVIKRSLSLSGDATTTADLLPTPPSDLTSSGMRRSSSMSQLTPTQLSEPLPSGTKKQLKKEY